MRAREILQEDYNQSLVSDLNNILIGAKGSGASDVNTQDVVNQLYKMGYSIDINSIIPLLSNNPVVQNATPETIVMTSPVGVSTSNAGGGEQDSADQVSAMAQKATQKAG
jgi:hypothetical protein